MGERGEQWTEVLSWEPRAFIYHNFLVRALDCFIGFLSLMIFMCFVFFSSFFN